MTPTNRLRGFRSALVLLFGTLAACSPPPTYDLVLRGGTIYDGSGNAGYVGDVAIDGDTIVARMTMKNLLDELDTAIFARIHRSTVVNVARIERLKPLGKGEAMLFLKQGKALKVSRSYGETVRRLLN